MAFLKTVLTLVSVLCISQCLTIHRPVQDKPEAKKAKRPREWMCKELVNCMFYMQLKHTKIPGLTDVEFEQKFNKTVEKHECGLQEKQRGDPLKGMNNVI